MLLQWLGANTRWQRQQSVSCGAPHGTSRHCRRMLAIERPIRQFIRTTVPDLRWNRHEQLLRTCEIEFGIDRTKMRSKEGIENIFLCAPVFVAIPPAPIAAFCDHQFFARTLNCSFG